MVQSQPFGGFRLYTYLFPKWKSWELFGYSVHAAGDAAQELLCLQNYYRSKVSQKPPPSLKLLPSLRKHATTSHSRLFFSKQQSESKKPFCTSTKERQITPAAAGRSNAGLTYPSAGRRKPRGVLEAGGKMQRGFQSSTRPGLCSWAALVRFSNSRIAAKSLPMPEEFPEQHSRSFSNCFETTLSLLQ